jgi:hypothetical protein
MIRTKSLNALPYVVIMSACKGVSQADDITNTLELLHILNCMQDNGAPIEFKKVTGWYKGTREESYMITFQDAAYIEVFANMGEWFNQESILVREFMSNGLPVVNLYFMDYSESVQGYINSNWHKETIGHAFKAVCDTRYTNDPLPEACTIINFKCWVVC